MMSMSLLMEMSQKEFGEDAYMLGEDAYVEHQ